jgi:hypothetical protein
MSRAAEFALEADLSLPLVGGSHQGDASVPLRVPAFVRRSVFLTLGLLAATALSVVPGQRAFAISQGTAITTAVPWAAYVTTVDKFLFRQIGA